MWSLSSCAALFCPSLVVTVQKDASLTPTDRTWSTDSQWFAIVGWLLLALGVAAGLYERFTCIQLWAWRESGCDSERGGLRCVLRDLSRVHQWCATMFSKHNPLAVPCYRLYPPLLGSACVGARLASGGLRYWQMFTVGEAMALGFDAKPSLEILLG